MPQRWGIRFAVTGDLRFLSHHETMRAVERSCARAALPLRYSQGFNPRPLFSLLPPRPVGVGTRDDLLTLSLAEGETLEGSEILDRLNRSAPEGMRFVAARRLDHGEKPRPRRVRYELTLAPDRARLTAERLEQLRDEPEWHVERLVSSKGRKHPRTPRRIDLRPLIEAVEITDHTLVWTHQPQGDLWARPGEFLRLLGLDEQGDLAATVRTGVDCGEPFHAAAEPN